MTSKYEKNRMASLVGISFKKTDKNVIINYRDNGKGIDVNKSGLHNVENRIQAIKSGIDSNSAPDKGFGIFLKFPL